MEQKEHVTVPRWVIAEVLVRAQDIVKILTHMEDGVGPPEGELAGLLRVARDHACAIAGLFGDEG